MSIQYNVIIEKEGQGALIDWGNSPGWIEQHRELLDNAERMTLIPKEGISLPVVSVALGPDRRWILFSRVAGIINTKKGDQQEKVRLYAIGWQSTVSGVNAKSITWVYPNGVIENAEEPAFIQHYLGRPEQPLEQIGDHS